MDISLKSTPARWWGTHKEKIQNWYQCQRLLSIRFGIEQENIYVEKYDGMGKPKEHAEICITQWILVPTGEWPHHFIHKLEGIPRNWCTELEQHRKIAN